MKNWEAQAMIDTLKNWANSDYVCDRFLSSHVNRFTYFGEGSKPLSEDQIKKLKIPEDQLLEAEKMARLASVADIISQIFKIALELILFPIFCVGMIGHAITYIVTDLYKGNEYSSKSAKLVLWAFGYPALSIATRLYLSVVDVCCSVGLITPSQAVYDRQKAFQKNWSLLTFVKRYTVKNIMPC